MGETLEVTLPDALEVANRQQVIDALAAGLQPGVRLVRLDASALCRIDSAGMGALARVLRMCIEATGSAPRLVHASEDIRDTLRSVLLLRHFE